VSRADQPGLVQEVAAVAAAAGQDPPAEIVLTLDANAAVCELGAAPLRPGRRVLYLGLPLLAALSREQFRAVLAHEFGHYAAGDTRLGAWLWRTRQMMCRTIVAVREGGSLPHRAVSRPLIAYGNAFVRVTEAISRRQELAADRLAASLAGRSATSSALRRIGAIAEEWHAFWRASALPLVAGGHMPPLAAGFAQMLETPESLMHVERLVEDRLAGEKPDPFSSHPTLRERLDNLAAIPDGRKRLVTREEPALWLVAELDLVEARLLAALDGERAGTLAPIGWDEAAADALVPAARERLAAAPDALEGVIAGAPPCTPAELDRLAERLAAGSGDRDARLAATAAHIVDALTVALVDAGWMPACRPGEPLSLSRGEHMLLPGPLVRALCQGRVAAPEWWDQAVGMGIERVPLGRPRDPGFVARSAMPAERAPSVRAPSVPAPPLLNAPAPRARY
jgi:Zn-dependent protease with chaperone function